MSKEWQEYFIAYKKYLLAATEYYWNLVEWNMNNVARGDDEGSNPPSPPTPPKPPGGNEG